MSNLRTLCKYHHNKRHGRFEHNPNNRKTNLMMKTGEQKLYKK